MQSVTLLFHVEDECYHNILECYRQDLEIRLSRKDVINRPSLQYLLDQANSNNPDPLDFAHWFNFHTQIRAFDGDAVSDAYCLSIGQAHQGEPSD